MAAMVRSIRSRVGQELIEIVRSISKSKWRFASPEFDTRVQEESVLGINCKTELDNCFSAEEARSKAEIKL